MPVKLAVLASGSGSNFESLIAAEKEGALGGAKIVLLVSDNPEAYALERAKQHGIPTHVLPVKEGKEAWEKDLVETLLSADADWVLLAGFLRILSGDFIRHFEGRIVNIHPSLLPKYGGRGYYGLRVHEAVLAHDEKESGASVHFVIEGCDEGPVILQEKVPVMPGDTSEELQQRVLRMEHTLYPEAVRRLVKGEV